jgi:hypothetical protein
MQTSENWHPRSEPAAGHLLHEVSCLLSGQEDELSEAQRSAWKSGLHQRVATMVDQMIRLSGRTPKKMSNIRQAAGRLAALLSAPL